MSVLNGQSLLLACPIKDMIPHKLREHGVSYGLSEVGYDLRVKQEIAYHPPNPFDYWSLMNHKNPHDIEKHINNIKKAFHGWTDVINENNEVTTKIGRTALASSVEEFDLPNHLWGELRNKSSHARRFFDATLGTDMEPCWKGFLTIEIIFHDIEPVVIPAGSAIAKAVFHQLSDVASYEGKYQNQPDKPIPPIFEKS